MIECGNKWLIYDEQALKPRKALCTTDSAPTDNVLSPVHSMLPSSTPGADSATKSSTSLLLWSSLTTPCNGLSRGLLFFSLSPFDVPSFGLSLMDA